MLERVVGTRRGGEVEKGGERRRHNVRGGGREKGKKREKEQLGIGEWWDEGSLEEDRCGGGKGKGTIEREEWGGGGGDVGGRGGEKGGRW